MGGRVDCAEGTALVIDTDTDESDPWLGLKNADGVRAIVV